MRIVSLHWRVAKMTSISSVLLGFTLMLAACAAPSQYMGIDLASPTVSSEVQSLAHRAQAGDKYAQLELGIRFEEGDGVARDLKKAKKLYQQAASDSGGTIWVYSPPVGNGTKGRTIPVDTGPRQGGLDEAKRRLEGIDPTLTSAGEVVRSIGGGRIEALPSNERGGASSGEEGQYPKVLASGLRNGPILAISEALYRANLRGEQVDLELQSENLHSLADSDREHIIKVALEVASFETPRLRWMSAPCKINSRCRVKFSRISTAASDDRSSLFKETEADQFIKLDDFFGSFEQNGFSSCTDAVENRVRHQLPFDPNYDEYFCDEENRTIIRIRFNPRVKGGADDIRLVYYIGMVEYLGD